MRLSAFRIQNFRSIIDSNWHNFSPDNITCLIGQNESGKTSILEALHAFHHGIISEDILRSDMSLPIVSCRFQVPDGWLSETVETTDKALVDYVASLNTMEIKRHWNADLSSQLLIGGEIGHYLESIELELKAHFDKLTQVCQNKYDLLKSTHQTVNTLKKNCQEIRFKLGQGSSNGFSISGLKRKFAAKDSGVKADLTALKIELSSCENQLKQKSQQLEELSPFEKELTKWNTIQQYLQECQESIKAIELGAIINPQRHSKEASSTQHNWTDLHEKIIRNEDLYHRQTILCSELINGKPYSYAEQVAYKTIMEKNKSVSREELGQQLFSKTPTFQLFEDFGSLLPNRIDLDDIITENKQVEGYKAARNFLIIAGLDYGFFIQPSNRILKQTIENLNTSLTLHFHEFWQQYISDDNKIRINFELNHYDASHQEKAGKPYLEFWIKDEGERLYPKQRSRGVRWFLSFYLELKASALMDNQGSILLVDEPGVSLHARAQEDVLKVFDNVKDRIQIMYSTHSPHLVDTHKLHRLLAVQRKNDNNRMSASLVLKPSQLTDASPDTLSPLNSIMGNPLRSDDFSANLHNLIVNDIGTFYFIKAILKLVNFDQKLHLIPSTDVSSIPLMCNILLGWGMPFSVLVFSQLHERQIADKIKTRMFPGDSPKDDHFIIMPKGFNNAEDILSTLDFKKHIIKNREGITVQNSIYIEERELPRNFMMSQYLERVTSGQVTINDHDEESIENIHQLVNAIKRIC